jgi:acetyltransferase-like isoleucine patch superfamily enzyme
MSFVKFVVRRSALFLGLGVAGVASVLRDTWIRAGWRARGVRLARGVVVRAHVPEAIQLDDGVAVGRGTLLLATTEMSLLQPESSMLRVGPATAINEYCNLRACGGTIEIGTKCLLGQFVTIVASNHGTEIGQPMMDQPWAATPHSVKLGDDVWLGAGVTVLPGARIGNGAVIAAGAVVRGDIPPGEIWGGVPARFIRMRVPMDGSAARLASHFGEQRP